MPQHWLDVVDLGCGTGLFGRLLRQRARKLTGVDLSPNMLKVARQRLHWPILDAFRDAAEACGIPKVDDFNRGDNFGCGFFEVNQRGIRDRAILEVQEPEPGQPPQ